MFHTSRGCRAQGTARWLMTAGLFALLSLSMSRADEDAESPYDQLWQQVSALVEVREYAAAAELIQDAESDSALAGFRQQLKADRKDMQELQRLAALVKEEAAKLQPGTPIKLAGVDYKVVRFVSDAQGDRLVLESAKGSTKLEKTLAELDPKSWLALAQPRLTTSAEDRYVVGMFHASVEYGDRKSARQALNLAAEDQLAVTHWTARLDAEAKANAQKRIAKQAELNDPIQGAWRIVIGKGKKERKINLVIKEKGRTDFKTSTWRKLSQGHYVFTFPGGGTAKVTLVPDGEGLKGKTANGTPVQGFRRAKDKR